MWQAYKVEIITICKQSVTEKYPFELRTSVLSMGLNLLCVNAAHTLYRGVQISVGSKHQSMFNTELNPT